MVSDEKFRLEYASEDNLKIMNYAIKPFFFLDDEDLLECKLDGLWKALSTYDETKSTFFYYLVKNIRWNCLKKIRNNQKHIPSGIVDKTYYTDFHEIEVNELIDKLDPLSQSLIQQRFIDGMTYRQIGQINGYSAENARQKIKKILKELKSMVE